MHPGLIDVADIDIVDGVLSSKSLGEVYDYRPGWGHPSAADRAEIERLMAPSLV